MCGQSIDATSNSPVDLLAGAELSRQTMISARFALNELPAAWAKSEAQSVGPDPAHSKDQVVTGPVVPGQFVPGIHFARKYSDTIEPEYRSQPQNAVQKILFSGSELVSLHYLAGTIVAAEYSQLRNADPKYGSNGEAYLQRMGAAGARGASQLVYSGAVLAPFLHEDMRYYVLGSEHHVATRILYAASRVFVTRSDSGHNTLNIAQLVGYGGGAATSQFYYPTGDRNASVMLRGYRSSLEGLAIDHEASEFLRFLFRHQPRY
jgi:hypothetical protein